MEMETWQKVVLAIVGAWIVYSIVVWICIKYAFRLGLETKHVAWMSKYLWPYTILGVFKIPA
jgi:hypothetical protein